MGLWTARSVTNYSTVQSLAQAALRASARCRARWGLAQAVLRASTRWRARWGPNYLGKRGYRQELFFLRTQFLKQFLAWRFALSFGLLLGRLLGRYLGGLLNLMVQWLLRSFLAVCLAGRCLAVCWVVAGRLVAAFDFRRRFVRPSELGMWTARPVYKSITRNRCCGNVSCHLTSTKPLKCRGKRGSSSPVRQRALARACWVSCAMLHMSTRRQGSHEPNPSAE